MEFRPVLPKQSFSPGDSVQVSLEVLPVKSFVERLKRIEFSNPQLSKWVSNNTKVKSVNIKGQKLRITIAQDHPLIGLSIFELNAKLDRYPGLSNQHGGVFLDCSFLDYVGRIFRLRISHNGFSMPEFQVDRGAGFEKVSMLSFDGSRLTFRYGMRALSTVHLKAPSEAQYGLGSPRVYFGSYLDSVRGKFNLSLMLNQVKIKRKFEQTMLQFGSSYDQGRIGAEIAYISGIKFFHLRDLVIEEPSKGGKDLYTSDRAVSIQARMIRDTPARKLERSIRLELDSLVTKLHQDFRYNPGMRLGYAVLSFVRSGNAVTTMLLRVPNLDNDNA
jgi:hypothetical protein